MKTINLSREDWLTWRKDKIGASDCPVILGICPWKRPGKLWQQKLGLCEDTFCTSRMQRGNDLEPIARDLFTERTGIPIESVTCIHATREWMVAQLDGYNAEHNCIVEIKCPSADSHAKAHRGIIPDNYMAQMQHQFEVSGATHGYYVSFDGDKDLVIIDVKPDAAYIARILIAEQAFYISMQDMEPPHENALPPIERIDAHYMNLLARYAECKEQVDLYSASLDAIKSEIIEASDGRSCMSNGFTVTKSVRKGNVNYGIIPQLKDVDLEPYRGKESETWTIRKQK